MNAVDILSCIATQVLKGESKSVRILQIFFALGVAILIHGKILRKVNYCLLGFMLILITLAFIITRHMLKNKLNDIIHSLVNEILDNINDFLKLANSTLFGDRNLLEDMLNIFIKDESKFKRFIKSVYSALLFIASGILLLLWFAIAFSMLNHGVLSRFLSVSTTDGYTLIILSWLLMTIIIQNRPTSHTEGSTGSKQDLQHLASSIVEKYTYENIVKKRKNSVLLSAIYSIISLIPILRVNTKKLTFELGLYVCNSRLYDLIEDLRRSGKAEIVEGDPVKLFNCSHLNTVEKWVDLQNISAIEALSKLLGLDRERKSNPNLLRIIIKDNDKPVAQVILRAWKGRKINVRQRTKRGKGVKFEVYPIGWRLISVFMIGIQEYIEGLQLQFELNARRATDKNLMLAEISGS